MSRTTKILASAYDRARLHDIRVTPTERRLMVIDLKAVTDAARTIVSAVVELDVSGVATLSDGAISGRTVQCRITGWRSGCVGGRAVMTLDDGDKYAQQFVVRVAGTDFDADPQPAGSLMLNIS